MNAIYGNKRLKVLAYHNVLNKERFEQQITYLKSHFNLISLTKLGEYFFNEKDLPDNALLVTFDDGDKSLYENAFPILKKHNIPAVIFIITGLIDTHKPFWWDEIEYYLGKEEGNKKVWEVKNWSNKSRVEYLASIREKSDKPFFTYTQLTSTQLNEIQMGGIDIANHSHTHPMFNQCTFEELENEMEESKNILNALNLYADIFAYPNGNYSEISEGILKKAGVKIAFLFDHKKNKGNINPLRISRLMVNDNTSILKLKFILSGWHGKFLPIIKVASKFFKK